MPSGDLPTPAPTPAPTLVSKSTPTATHLDAGATLANRYRIVTHLGKGGMGDVYRADDLTLGVPVALKFLPPSLAQDPVRLERFRAEVRLARQVSHANVCRVYDIGESGGGGAGAPQVFISMEYVDGEDLSGLLRRIGRLPSEKAIHIARQLCFGLGAAHEQGIIHRDLKPANIMIDGRGNARIMDFGIADAAATLAQHTGHHPGTPGYMSPEQLGGGGGAGGELTKRSDIYSLGVVLYELFTGRAAFTATGLDDLRRLQQQSSSLSRPSTFVNDLDPAIERIILHCLEPDPKNRPPSAMAIAAALPGGDPLAAALAAGETPSPELIAAAGAGPAFSPVQAWGRAALIAAMLAAIVFLTESWSMVSQVKPSKTPDALRDKASEITRALGYTDPPVDSASDFSPRTLYIQSVNLNKEITSKVERLRARPGAYEFWYRQSPATIESDERDGAVSLLSPFPSTTGEVLIRTDSSGRLEFFAGLPSRKRTNTAAEPDDATIKQLFTWADLDPARFTPADPIFRPFIPVDSMKSWTGSLPDRPELPIRIHIGSAEGKVAYFSVAYPWGVAALEARPQPPPPRTFYDYGPAIIFFLILAGTCYLAARSLRSGRGDRASALRVALVVFAFASVMVLFTQHHFPAFRSILLQGRGFVYPVFAGVEFWLFYTALEPYARRVYPHALVSWTRMLRGSLGDPTVGRHILIGMMVGATSVFVTAAFAAASRGTILPGGAIAFYGRTAVLTRGFSGVSAATADTFVTAFMLGAGGMLPLVVGQIATRTRWAGYIFLGITMAALQVNTLRFNTVEGIASVVIAVIPIVAIPRGGLLALVVTHLTIFLASSLPAGLDWSHWFTAPTFIPASILAALLILSARAASGGRAFQV